MSNSTGGIAGHEPLDAPSLALAMWAALIAAAGATTDGQIDAITSALRAQDFDKAVELSRGALKASPADAQLWTLQGIALSRKGDARGALTSFQTGADALSRLHPGLEGAAQLHYQAGSRDAVPLLNRL